MTTRFRLACFVVHGLVLGHAAAATVPKPVPRVALVVGNAKYESAVGSLRNAVNDAKAVAKTLRGLGFAVIEEHNVTRDELLKAVAGSLIAFATDAGRTAQDGEGVNGLYTEELLKNLRTPGLTIEQVFKRTRAGVMDRSAGGQIPAEYSRLVGDDIFLAGPAPAASQPATTTTAPPVQPAERAIKAIPVQPPDAACLGPQR